MNGDKPQKLELLLLFYVKPSIKTGEKLTFMDQSSSDIERNHSTINPLSSLMKGLDIFLND